MAAVTVRSVLSTSGSLRLDAPTGIRSMAGERTRAPDGGASAFPTNSESRCGRIGVVTA